MKILLIEDDIEISEMLCSYLIAENFEVVCATDGGIIKRISYTLHIWVVHFIIKEVSIWQHY